jgi:hypothetical protein
MVTLHLFLLFLHKIKIFSRLQQLVPTSTVRTFAVIFLKRTLRFNQMQLLPPLQKTELVLVCTYLSVVSF